MDKEAIVGNGHNDRSVVEGDRLSSTVTYTSHFGRELLSTMNLPKD